MELPGALASFQHCLPSSLWIPRPITARKLSLQTLLFRERVSQQHILSSDHSADSTLVFLQAVLNGLMTIPFIITVLFCIGDPLDVLFNSPIGFTSPFTQIMLNSTGSPAAAVILNVISTFVAFAAGLDLWGAAARAMWSLARDGGLPEYFTHIHPKYDVPIPALLIMVPPALIIAMIYIFNTTAFYVSPSAGKNLLCLPNKFHRE